MSKRQEYGTYPLFLTPEQASKISGLGINRLRQLMEEGQLEYLPVGNRRLTTVEALMDYYRRAKVPVIA
ncbi:MAG: DNA-binding protein [Clostridia bacterium]|nr:DNA-binding protein [Clostridia bacterium]